MCILFVEFKSIYQECSSVAAKVLIITSSRRAYVSSALIYFSTLTYTTAVYIYVAKEIKLSISVQFIMF